MTDLKNVICAMVIQSYAHGAKRMKRGVIVATKQEANIFLKCGQRICVELSDGDFDNISSHVGTNSEIAFQQIDYAIAMSEVAAVVKIEPERHRGC